MPEPVENPVENPDDTRLFDRLRAMWSELDPVPEDLADDLVAAVAADDLGFEWAQLELTGADLAGVRSIRRDGTDRSEVATMEFHLGSVALVVRIARDPHGTRRLDGWLSDDDDAIPSTTELVLTSTPAEQRTTIDAHGRFTFTSVPADRPWRLRVDLGGHGRRFETPDLEW